MLLQLSFTVDCFFIFNWVTEIVFWEPFESSALGNSARLCHSLPLRVEFTDLPQNSAALQEGVAISIHTLIDQSPPARSHWGEKDKYTKGKTAQGCVFAYVWVSVCIFEIACTLIYSCGGVRTRIWTPGRALRATAPNKRIILELCYHLLEVITQQTFQVSSWRLNLGRNKVVLPATPHTSWMSFLLWCIYKVKLMFMSCYAC